MYKNKICKIVAGILEMDLEEIVEYDIDQSLEVAGFDSMCFVRTVVQLEEVFSIEINDSDLVVENFITLNKIFKIIEKYIFNGRNVKKVIITDCDNVLWRGVAGEEELRFDKVTMAFQNLLVRLYNSGILICLCSRNDPVNIDFAFSELDMVLKKEYILTKRINCNDKATNILSIAEEIKLLPESFVFIDDSDYELGLVSALIGGIKVVKALDNKIDWIDEVEKMFGLVPADMNRTQLYIEQKDRERDKFHFHSIGEYNALLKTEILCAEATAGQAVRLAELSQRTNQFNLATSRYSKDEIISKIESKEYLVIALSASDKYGDMGIVGMAILRISEKIVIEGFMLSCRVFDRGFENVMLEKIKDMNLGKKIYGVLKQNDKNRNFCDFYRNNGIECL